ncbi:hypothetical protein RFI_36826, partial [Reticulomyxa filosa]
MLNVIGFQSQAIQNYINVYFKNNNESDVLNNNRSLKLLSHTPLYLILFCYLSRQDRPSSSNNDKWDEMTLSKLYETLLKGLKCGQAIISCEIQQRVIKYKYLRKDISVKLNEQQLDDVIKLFMDGIVGKDEGIHLVCIFSIAEIALKLNKVFECLMNGKITICKECAHALAKIASQLGGKQLDNALQCFIHRFSSYFYNDGYYTYATQFIMKLEEGQLGDVFKFLIGRLSDEKENDGVRIKCAELIGKISMKWNEKQLK